MRVRRSSRSSRSPRRLWWLPVLLGLIGAAAGAYVGMHRPYEASATVLVTPLEGNPFSPTGTGEDLVNLESEAQLLASDGVARRVAADLRYTGDPRDLLHGLTVAVPANTQVLTVGYRASSRTQAVRRAQSFSKAYLDVRTARAEDVVVSQRDLIQRQIDESESLGGQLAATRAGARNRTQIAALDRQLSALQDRISSLRQRLQDLPPTTASPGDVVNSAVVKKPFGPVPPLVVFGLLGLVVMAALGLALAQVRSRSGGRVRHPDDVTASGLDVLSTVSQRSASAVKKRVLAGEAPDPDALAELDGPMSRLRTAILLRRTRPLPISVLIATASGDTTSAVTAAGLARSLAQSDLRVALVDLGGMSVNGHGAAHSHSATADPTADPVDGSGVDGSGDGRHERAGLLAVLQGHSRVDEVVRGLEPGIELVATGEDVTAVHHLMVNPRMEAMLDELEGRSDVVLVAAGSIHEPGVQTVADMVDAIVVEVTEGVTTRRELALLTRLTGLSSRLNGVVYVSSRTRP